MLLTVLLYAGIGASLGIATLSFSGPRQRVDRLADRVGMTTGYARSVWLGGTFIAWPIGLFVLATDRLILVDAERRSTAVDSAKKNSKQSAACVRRYPEPVDRQPAEAPLLRRPTMTVKAAQPPTSFQLSATADHKSPITHRRSQPHRSALELIDRA